MHVPSLLWPGGESEEACFIGEESAARVADLQGLSLQLTAPFRHLLELICELMTGCAFVWWPNGSDAVVSQWKEVSTGASKLPTSRNSTLDSSRLSTQSTNPSISSGCRIPIQGTDKALRPFN